MFGSHVLEVVVGLSMFFVLLSFACTGATEAVLGFFFVKERNMSAGLAHLLRAQGDADLPRRLFAHPLVRSLEGRQVVLAQGPFWFRSARPVEIPGATFRQVLPDILGASRDSAGQAWAARLELAMAGVEAATPDHDLVRLLRTLQSDAADRSVPLHEVVEGWYDDAVEAIKGRYRRRARTWALAVATLAVVAVNADALMMFDLMSRDAALAAVLTGAAEQLAGAGAASVEAAQVAMAGAKAAVAEVGTPGWLGVPLGWELDAAPGTPRALPTSGALLARKLVGLLITAFGASLGASFWFDLIKRLVTARQALAAASAQAD